MTDHHPHDHNCDPHDDPNAKVFMGVAISVTEMDKETAEEKGEVMLNIAQDLDSGVVFIALTDMGTEKLDFRGGGRAGDGIQRVFELGLVDWAAFNASLQKQIREQMMARYGIPNTATPEQAIQSLLDGLGAGD